MNFLSNYIYYMGSFGLIAIGLSIILLKSNLIKVIIGINVLDTGVNLFLISIGYLQGGTAPVFVSGTQIAESSMVDPTPQALVLTAIVIGASILALGSSLSIKLYSHYGTLNLKEIRGQKW